MVLTRVPLPLNSRLLRQLTTTDIQSNITETWEGICAWVARKPRLLALPRPEQQIGFEFACRLREALRGACRFPKWDRLFFDATYSIASETTHVDGVGRQPPIYLDTHQLIGRLPNAAPDSTLCDFAVAVHVLRASHELLDLDEDGRPRHQMWLPQSMLLQGARLEEQVREFERLAERGVEGYLFVLYVNQANRKTAVDSRAVASWATWRELGTGLSATSRRFRVRSSRAPSPP